MRWPVGISISCLGEGRLGDQALENSGSNVNLKSDTAALAENAMASLVLNIDAFALE
jgi:hypothetical protein